jgi:hypothetical protein
VNLLDNYTRLGIVYSFGVWTLTTLSKPPVYAIASFSSAMYFLILPAVGVTVDISKILTASQLPENHPLILYDTQKPRVKIVGN